MPSEKETRERLIDAQLRTASWAIDDPTQVVREFRIGSAAFTAEEPRSVEGAILYSDYVLLGKNGQPLAVVEAKKSFVYAAIVEKVEGIKSRHQQGVLDLESFYGTLSQTVFAGELDLVRMSS